MIITFYSYKGGVGRTQLCANIAAYLCFHEAKKVLLWDWDFEAPGLHFYFDRKREEINKPGTLELFEEYVALMRSSSDVTTKNLNYITEENIIPLEKYKNSQGETGCIDLLAAGVYEQNFSRRSGDFNWFEFYELLDGGNYIEFLKEKLKELSYDYIIIDSRTGTSDYSGICNIQLPDINVLIMAPNQQNFKGCKRVALQIIDSEYVKQGFRKPYILPILSRLDRNHAKSNSWTKRFIEDFSFLLPYLDPKIDEDFLSKIFEDIYLQDTFLEYIYSISAGENIFINETVSKHSSISFERKYMNIADYLIKLSDDNTLELSSRVSPLTWVELGRFLQNKNKYEKASECYNEAIKTNPNNAYAWFSLGLSLSHQKAYDKASEAYQKALNITPTHYKAWNNLGNVYRQLGLYDKSIGAFQKAIKIKPEQPVTWTNLGNVYDEMNQYQDAIDSYQKAIDIDPNYEFAIGNWGFTLLQQGDLQNALKKIQQSIALGNNVSGNMNLGHVYFALHRETEALTAYLESYRNFVDKDFFWDDFKGDYPHLAPYKISEQMYQEMEQKIKDNIE